MPYVFDSKTQQMTWVPDDKVEDALKTGRVTFPKGTQVPVNIGGEYQTVDESELSNVFNNGGHYDMASQRYIRHEEKYYDEKNLTTLALGLGRGAFGHYSDWALGKMGADIEELQKFHDYNPGFSIAGQVGGAVGTSLLSGGVGIAGRAGLAAASAKGGLGLARGALTTASKFTISGQTARLGTKLGGMAAGQASKLGAVGASALDASMKARAAGTAAGMAGQAATQGALGRAFTGIVGGAVEGGVDVGLFGAANMLAEQALGSPSEFSEDLVSQMGMGVLFGGGIGGVLRGAGIGESLEMASSAISVADKGWSLPRNSKIAKIFEDAAAGDPEVLEKLSKLQRFAEGDEATEQFFMDVIGEDASGVKRSWRELQEMAATDVFNTAKAAQDLQNNPVYWTPVAKKAGWGKYIGEPTELATDGGRAASDPLGTITESLNKIRPINDTLAGVMAQQGDIYNTKGIPLVHKELKQIQSGLEDTLKSILGIPKKAKVKFDSEIGEYVFTFPQKPGAYDFAHGKKGFEEKYGHPRPASEADLPLPPREKGKWPIKVKTFSELAEAQSTSRIAGRMDRSRSSLIDAFTELDKAKRVIGQRQFSNWIWDLEQRGIALSAQRTDAVIQQQRRGLLEFLEDQTTWGKAAEAQAGINKSLSMLLSQQKAFYGSFAKKMKLSPQETGVELYKLDVDKIRKNFIAPILKDVPDDQTQPAVQAMNEFNDSIATWKGEVGKWFGDVKVKGKDGKLTPVLGSDFDSLSKKYDSLVEKQGETMLRLKEVGGARQVIADLSQGVEAGAGKDAAVAMLKYLSGGKGGRLGLTVGGIMGGVSGGIAGGLGGLAINKIGNASKSPYQRITELTRLKAKQIQARAKYKKTVDKVVNRMVQNRKAGWFGGADKITNKSWHIRLAPVLAMNESKWQSRDERKRTEEAIKTLQRWRSDPASLEGRILVATSMLGGRAPNVREALSAQVRQMCNYAANNVPNSIVIMTDPFTGEERISGPDFAFGEFNDMMQTLDIGLDFIAQNFVRGTLTAHMVDAWKINFPEQYTNFCSDIMTKASPKKRNISYAMRGQVSTLFGVPLEPTFSGANVKAMQMTWEARKMEEEQAGMGGTNRPAALKSMARNAETQSNRLLGPNSN